MASLRMRLLDLLNKSEQGADPNFLHDGVQLLARELMDAEVTDLVGAVPHQRTMSRTTYRNGHRDRERDTRVGTLELQIPKLRQGTYFQSLLEPRRRHERAHGIVGGARVPAGVPDAGFHIARLVAAGLFYGRGPLSDFAIQETSYLPTEMFERLLQLLGFGGLDRSSPFSFSQSS